MFKKIKPQKVQHICKKYIVQSKTREYMEYINGKFVATVEVDRGMNDIVIFLDGIKVNNKKLNILESEKIAKRVAKGIRAMGVETVTIE